ncbi:FG-GAP-like repeat-containing protein, partial [Candidatus Symbiothrix dinenymphae]|uniref:FG-GAP-like repeat-containing protein n=1 Tax=Candidatus Symbiothrix dinenymphae TaxID=467085 RepID=UPI000B21FED0
MKKIYIKFWIVLTGIFCVPPSVFSQTIEEAREWTFAAPVSGNKTYVALDSITLKPGFSYTATSGNSFIGRIDQTLLFPPTGNTYARPDGTIRSSSTEGAMVGNLSGTLDVSPSGAATYSVPIEVPAGIQGLQPSISLVYNSQVGNGLVGWGCNLSGISVITRGTRDIYHDGAAGGLTHFIGDAYYLDGQRLLLHASAGPVGDEGALYFPESDPFTLVIVHGTYTTTIADTWFEVVTKDGKVYYYGRTTGARQSYTAGRSTPRINAWYLDYVEDAFGNYMNYTYHKDNYFVRPNTITYGKNKNETTPSENTVSFNYTSRSDKVPFVMEGVKGSMSYRLSGITSKTGSTTYREYVFEYAETDNFSRLKTITEKNGAGEHFNPIILSWDVLPAFSQTASSLTFNTGSVSTSAGYGAQSFFAADMNGNGLSDLVGTYMSGSSKYAIVYKASLSSGNVQFSPTTIYNCGEHSVSLLPLDFNGDGINELVSPELVGNTLKFNFVNSNSKLFSTTLISGEVPEFAIADMNNDGRVDIIFIDKGQSSNRYPCYIIGHNQDSDAAIYKASFNLTLPSKPEKLFVADYDGDGLNDVFVVHSTGYTIFWNRGTGISNSALSDAGSTSETLFNKDYRYIKIGDFNGDGLPDFIVNEHCNANWHIIMNNGNKTFTKTKSTVISNLNIIEEEYTNRNDNKDQCFVMDFDGDGKSDIIINDAVYDRKTDWWYDNFGIGEPWGEFNKHRVYWFRSTGTSFELYKTVIYDKDDALSQYFAIGDFSGTGRQELMFYGFDCSATRQISTAKEQKWRLYKRSGYTANSGKVTSITNSLQNKTTLEYASLANGGIYTKGTGAQYPVMDMQAPLYAVKKVTANAGTTEASATDYTYKGAKVHTQGKGFLGFNEVVALNSKTNHKTTTSYGYDPTYYIPYIAEQKITLESSYSRTITAISTTTNTKTYRKLANKRIVPYINSQTIRDGLTGLSVTTKTSDYDEDGNPETIKITKGNLVETQTRYYVWRGPRCVPDYVSVKKEYDGNTYTRTSTYEYNTQGAMTKEIIDPDDGNKVETVYSNFTNFGQPKTIKVTTNGQTRTSTVAYTSSGRFIRSKTNHLGETTTYDWDEARGLLNSENNRLGSTSYKYDGWGRLTNTTYPDGLKSVATLQWAGSTAGKPTNAKYYSYAETSGQSPVIIWYDALGRELRSESYGLSKKKIWVDTEYNTKGQVYRVSEPYFDTGTKTWASTYSYNIYGMIDSIVTPMGTTNYAYLGFTTIVTTPTDTKETTINAAGLVVSETTNEKTVNFTHYASGLVKTATPEGDPKLNHELSMEYDLQGNRTKLTDPDAGTITSKYDGWGQLTEEKQKIHDNSYVTTSYNYATSGLLNYK